MDNGDALTGKEGYRPHGYLLYPLDPSESLLLQQNKG